MLTNAEFTQLTGIPQDAMTPELAELAMFSLPITCENGSTTDLWQVRAKTMTEMGTDLRGETEAFEAREAEKKAENMAAYARHVESGLWADGIPLQQVARHHRTR